MRTALNDESDRLTALLGCEPARRDALASWLAGIKTNRDRLARITSHANAELVPLETRRDQLIEELEILETVKGQLRAVQAQIKTADAGRNP